MEIGIDSFAAAPLSNKTDRSLDNSQALRELIDRIEWADKSGLDVLGIGEHYRKEFLDSAPSVILAAAAARTRRIRLTSAVTVLSAADPVRVFQNFATLDLISQGRAEMVVGRGSFTESFPLFGFDLHDPIPIQLGVGGTRESFVRAGSMGRPLMVAVIGGETHRFRSLVDLYRQAGVKAGFAPEQLKVGLHSLGYVAHSRKKAIEAYYPGYAETFSRIGKERGWPPVTRAGFDAQTGQFGALVIGSPEEVAEKILQHSTSLGGISRFTFQMDNAGLSHQQLMNSIELIGKQLVPIMNS